MFQTLLKTFAYVGQSRLRSMMMTGAVMTGLAGLPTAAFARHHDFHVDVAIPGPVVVSTPVVVSQPCEPVTQQVWVPPVYQTVTEKVWVPEVTTTQIQRVEIPAEYGYREVVHVDIFGRHHVRQERVLIAPARIVEKPVTVVVTPGHFEIQAHQQLVADGHYETRVVQPAPVVVQPAVRLEIPAPF
jgi:hypothetical protein